MIRLKEYRDKAKGVADLLNWAALVEDGIVLCKDGSLIAGWVYRGDDMGSASPEERNYHTAQVNASLARLGSGWATWFDSARLPAPGYPAPERSYFPDPVTAAIDEERRSQFTAHGAVYETEQVLIVQYKPPLRRNAKIADYIYDDDAPEADPGMRLLRTFKQQVDTIGNSLSTVLRLSRLRSYTHTDEEGHEMFRDHLVDYLSFCLTGDPAPVNIPPYGMYMDAYISSQEFWPGLTPRMGETFIMAVALEGFPAQSYPGLMDSLEGLAIRYRWSSRFIYLDAHQAVADLNSYRKSWKQKSRGFVAQVFKLNNSVVNEDALLMASEAQTALASAESGLVTYGYYSPVVILMGEDRAVLEESAAVLINEMKRRGVTGRLETVNTVEAFFGSLPGHTTPNIRRPVMHTLNMADMLPLASIWAGRDVNPCPFYPENSPPLLLAATTGSTPFRFNWHVGELGHGLIFGPTRSGKSTLLGTVAAQFRRYPRARVTAFDKGRSMWALTNAIGEKHGARHYDVAGDGETLAFAPLRNLETPADRLWAVEWIETCFQLQTRRERSSAEHRAIENAIDQLARAPRGARSLTDFNAAVQDVAVREAMRVYTLDGAAGHLLDAQDDGLDDAPFRVFEIENLLQLDSKIVIPTMSYIIRQFYRSLDGSPAMLIIDEAWTFFKNEIMRAKVEEWLRVLAKANCVVILATQSLADAVNSGLLPVLIESCATKIYLPNPEAEQAQPKRLYAEFGLNDTEIRLVAGAQRQRQYYVASFDGRRLIDLGLGRTALAFVGVSDKETIRHLEALKREYGADWPRMWVREREAAGPIEAVWPTYAEDEKAREYA